MRSDLLGSILSDLNGGSADIEASAVFDYVSHVACQSG